MSDFPHGEDPKHGARNSDPSTSKAAARQVSLTAGTQAATLLRAYLGGEPLIDEQAAMKAGVKIRSCWWKRCSELRFDGYIEVVTDEDGEPLTARSSMGKQGQLCRITAEGVAWCARNPEKS